MSAHRSTIQDTIARMGRGETVDLDSAWLRKITAESEGLSVAIAATELLRQMPVDPNADRHRVELLVAMGWKCAIDGCDRQSRSMTLCESHYRALRNMERAA